MHKRLCRSHYFSLFNSKGCHMAYKLDIISKPKQEKIMKRTLLFFLSVALFSSVGLAQKTPFFQLGIKAGANVTKVDGKAFTDEFKYGYHLGGFAALKVGKQWQIQPEVLFNQLNSRSGSSFDTLYDGANLKNIKLNYLSIPLLLNYTPTSFVSFQAGPQFGLLLNKADNLVENGRNAFRDGDLSMLAGIQFNIAHFKIGGRYVVGLKDIGDVTKQDKWTNQGFQLSLGLRIL
jgi:hypothetical protein